MKQKPCLKVALAVTVTIAGLLISSPASAAIEPKDFVYEADSKQIEIASLAQIENGVVVTVRAFENSSAIGFGRDGTVEYERIRVINPPQYIPDGTCENVVLYKNIRGCVANLTFAPDLALKQVIAETIAIIGKSGENIEPGKVGNTTTVVYPDAGTSLTTVDGFTKNTTPDDTWGNMRSGVGDSADTNDATRPLAYTEFVSGTTFSELGRGAYLFDTSSIPDADVISSATISFYGVSKADNGNQSISVVNVTPASNNTLVATDYSTFGTTRYTSDADITSLSTSAYNDISLNSTGLAAISQTGVSKFGTRLSGDVDNSAPSLTAGQESHFIAYNADQGGSTNDPKLTIEHAASGGGSSDSDVATTTPDSYPATFFFGFVILMVGFFLPIMAGRYIDHG